MSQPKTELILRAAADPALSGAELSDARVLVLAAHPDDETIGTSAVLGRFPGATAVYLTDGAPSDPQFRSPRVSGSRELYACVRAEEAASALSLVDVPQERILFLSGVDQEAIFRVGELIDEFVPILEDFKPSVIITHSYEGGHPDHDAAALVARLSAQMVRQNGDAPDVLEMTSYHSAEGKRVAGQFLTPVSVLAGSIGPTVHLKLSAEERTRKARMLGCYVSQWHVLSDFPLEPEQLRPAPFYDFTRPPHDGPLWYESLHWPLSGTRWRELAEQILTEFGELTCQ
ncbi:MAG TPA: PIG-L family deacetylase [Terriglobales bacterium]|nr:PIG-L family deacetylase [Terriglobales bacterium]